MVTAAILRRPTRNKQSPGDWHNRSPSCSDACREARRHLWRFGVDRSLNGQRLLVRAPAAPLTIHFLPPTLRSRAVILGDTYFVVPATIAVHATAVAVAMPDAMPRPAPTRRFFDGGWYLTAGWEIWDRTRVRACSNQAKRADKQSASEAHGVSFQRFSSIHRFGNSERPPTFLRLTRLSP
jgi:hypothetical protein